MVRRLFWEQENEGSNPSIPTRRVGSRLRPYLLADLGDHTYLTVCGLGSK